MKVWTTGKQATLSLPKPNGMRKKTLAEHSDHTTFQTFHNLLRCTLKKKEKTALFRSLHFYIFIYVCIDKGLYIKACLTFPTDATRERAT